MRTHFEIDEQDDYDAARQLLVRRCIAWAKKRGAFINESLLLGAIDSRHFSADGRLTHWTPGSVRFFILEWIPRYFDADADIDRCHEVVCSWLRFIEDTGLRDPRGASTEENEKAAHDAVDELPAAMADVARFGAGKVWSRLAHEYGYQASDDRTLRQFHEDLRHDRLTISDEHAEEMMMVELRFPPLGSERRYSQLPVVLPDETELEEHATRNLAVAQMRQLVEWIGRDGKPIHHGDGLNLSDTVDVCALLGLDTPTIDTPDSVPIEVRVLLALAYRLRLVRKYRGRVVAVARNASALDDARQLWSAMFRQLGEVPRAIFCQSRFEERSALDVTLPEALPLLCDSLYSLPEPMPMARLREITWQIASGGAWMFDLDSSGVEVKRHLETLDHDLRLLGAVLEWFGATERLVDVPHPMFVDDLLPLQDDDLSQSPFDPDISLRLAEELSHPCELIKLTDLATATLREDMISEGREAGLVGELSSAEAAEMLGVVSQHYSTASAADEIERWLMHHRADLSVLLDAARKTSLRSRCAAILELVASLDPESEKLLRRLRSDPVLAPTALVSLVEMQTLDMMDLTEYERQLLTAESSLRLMEMDGHEAIMEGLRELSTSDGHAVIKRVLTSAHPDQQAIDEFRTLIAEPFIAEDVPRPVVPQIRPERLGATRRARVKRRGPYA